MEELKLGVEREPKPQGGKPDGTDEPFNLKKELVEWIECIAVSLVAVVLLFTFVFRIVGVDGTSMNPTLQDQDRLIISHLFYTPKRGDIVVVTQPNGFNEPLIKRIIATGGQQVDVDFEKGTVTVDGVMLDEPYIKEPATVHHAGDIEFPVRVPEGCVFVMGDNRNNSSDSRSRQVGMIDEHYILGKAIFRIFPFQTIGLLQ